MRGWVSIGGLLAVLVAPSGAVSGGGKRAGDLEPGCKRCSPLTVYVSNQSFAEPRVSIEVSLGAKKLIAGAFEVGQQHSWERFEFQAKPGRLQLAGVAAGKVPAKCVVDLDLPRTAWLVVSYWGKDGLKCEASATPPAFL